MRCEGSELENTLKCSVHFDLETQKVDCQEAFSMASLNKGKRPVWFHIGVNPVCILYHVEAIKHPRLSQQWLYSFFNFTTLMRKRAGPHWSTVLSSWHKLVKAWLFAILACQSSAICNPASSEETAGVLYPVESDLVRGSCKHKFCSTTAYRRTEVDMYCTSLVPHESRPRRMKRVNVL